MLTHGQWSHPNVRLAVALKEIDMKIIGVLALLIGVSHVDSQVSSAQDSAPQPYTSISMK